VDIPLSDDFSAAVLDESDISEIASKGFNGHSIFRFPESDLLL
jgi:hypothetical protein